MVSFCGYALTYSGLQTGATESSSNARGVFWGGGGLWTFITILGVDKRYDAWLVWLLKEGDDATGQI